MHSSAATAQSSVQLTLTARPSVLPADSGSYPAVVIQFIDPTTQLPLAPSSDVTIQLSSSDPQTGTVPSSVTFPANALYDIVNFTTTTLPGTTTVYAVSQGYQPANLTVKTQTVGGIPTALRVYLSPNIIPSDGVTTSNVEVEAVDAFGNPVQLGTSVLVTLSSSNTQFGNLSSTLTIQAGTSYSQTTFYSTTSAGQTVITASAEGLAPGSAVMTTVKPSGGADALAIKFAPPILIADGGAYQNIVVQLINSTSGNPIPAPSNTIVNLTSSASSVGTVQNFIDIPAGQTYGRASFTTNGLPGSTYITATASDYTSTTGNLTLVTKAATSLGLYAAPSAVIANNYTYNNLIVELQDSSGNPEKTANSVDVSLQSLNPATATVPASVVIPAGSTFASIPLTTTSTTGQIQIVAFANGFKLGETTLQATVLPFNVQLVPTPVTVSAGSTSNIVLIVTSGGTPIANAAVQWTSTAGTFVSTSRTTDSSGQATATIRAASGVTTISVTATVSAPGFAPHTATTTLIVPKQASHPSGILGILMMNIIFIPLYMIIIAAGAGGGGAFAFFFFKRRGSYEEVVAGDEL